MRRDKRVRQRRREHTHRFAGNADRGRNPRSTIVLSVLSLAVSPYIRQHRGPRIEGVTGSCFLAG